MLDLLYSYSYAVRDSVEGLLSIQATVYSSKTTSNKLWAVKAEIWARTEFVLSRKIAKLGCSFNRGQNRLSEFAEISMEIGGSDIRKNTAAPRDEGSLQYFPMKFASKQER